MYLYYLFYITFLMDSTPVLDSMNRMPQIGDPECGHPSDCAKAIRSVQDAMDALEGRWKIQIIASLFYGTKRFKEISRQIPGITDKMLSKELKELETNQLVKRTVLETFPPRVDYSITEHGLTLKKLISELGIWGNLHREKILGKTS